MVEYKLVKYCRMCKKRFVVDKKEARTIYCEACQKKLAKEKPKK